MIDFSCLFDFNVARKEVRKINKYQDLLIEIQRLWNVRADVIPIVIGTLGALSPKFNDRLRKLGVHLKPYVLQKSVLLQTARLLCPTLSIHL